MPTISSVKLHILNQLIKGEFCSGELLGQELNISRAAVSKHIKAFQDMGIDIYSVTGKGYKLASALSLIDEQLLSDTVKTDFPSSQIEYIPVIDSTNSYLMAKAREANGVEPGHTVISEYQSNGRGRRGRQWYSPFGCNLYMSFAWPLENGFQGAMGLSSVVGIALLDVLQGIGITTAKLKWPNDVLINGKKAAGILVELEGQPDSMCTAIIGIGVNLAMPDVDKAVVDQPWHTLEAELNAKIDKSLFAQSLICALHRRLLVHAEKGVSAIVDEWQSLDHYFDKSVTLYMGEKQITGVAKGINDQGALLLNVDGHLQTYFGGEISVRAAK